MTDRELLEAAAKAAGLPLGYGDGEYFWCQHGPFGESMYGRRGHAPLNWNPLADDGDALRLAVKLGFDMMLYSDVKGVFHGDTGQQFAEDARNSDPAAAVRRAIVRAAAALAETRARADEAALVVARGRP